MSVLEGILLGLLQGVAEFLPISSSGHLAIAQKLFNLEMIKKQKIVTSLKLLKKVQ